MNLKTTFKQYKKTHPFGNFELFSEARRKLLVAQYNVNNTEKTPKPFCGSFTIWTEATQPQEKTTVYQVAKKLRKSTQELQQILEDKFNVIASKASHVPNYILVELF